MKLSCDTFVLEVTRRCNMSCAHCLRGDAQNLDITHEIIDKALTPVGSINSIVFSGGEPSLNVDAIRYTLNRCVERGINVASFYVVTNGKVVTPEFLQTCLDWYCFCVRNNPDMAKEYSGLSCSSDPWHEPIPEENRVLLEAFAFSRPEEHVITRSHYIINEGRARNLTDVRKRELYSLDISDLLEINSKKTECWVNEILYVSANGEIRTNCDTAFDEDRFTVGSVLDGDWVKRLIDYSGAVNCSA